MKYSIIIPLFNNEKYIEQCILSVLNQSYDNYEIIIINDGSEDKGAEICKRYVSDKVKLINTSNYGLSHARNLGIKYCTGDYVLFLDSDDYYSDDFLSEVNTVLEKNKYDLIFSKCNILNNIKLRKIIYDCEFDKQIVSNLTKEQLLKYLLKIKMKNVVWRYIVKREIIFQNNLFFNEDLKKFEDEEWTVKLLCYCNSYYYYDKQYYVYRVRDKSIMSDNQIKDLSYYLKAISSLLEFSKRKEISSYLDYVLYNCRRLLRYVEKRISKEFEEKSPKNKKIILVGLGKAGYLHYISYLKIGTIKKEDIILVDNSLEHSYFKNHKYFHDITSAMRYHNLNSKDVILDICVPKDCFKEITDEGKSLGIKNIIIEKPCMFTEKELQEYSDINIVMIQNYIYSKITRKLKKIIDTSTSKVIKISTNFSKNRINDSKKFRGGTNGKNVSVFEVEMPHQIYIVDYLINKKGIGNNQKINTRDFYEGDAHAYGNVCDDYNGIQITHLSNLCSKETIKSIQIQFADSLKIEANYLHYDNKLNKLKDGSIEVYYHDRKIFSETFFFDDNMFENIKYVYNCFNQNMLLENKEAIFLNSSQINHYKSLINS